MKTYTFYLLLVLFCIGQFSCSISIEKRRYRPGYYVNTVKPHHLNTQHVYTPQVDSVNQRVHVDRLEPNLVLQENKKRGMEDHQETKQTIDHRSPVKQTVKPPTVQFRKWDLPDKNKKIPQAMGEMSKRKITAWILGGISMLIALCSLASFAIPYAPLLFFGAIMGIAGIFAILAIIFGVTKSKAQKEKEKKEREEKNIPITVNQKYFTGSFIFSAIVVLLAIITMVLGMSYISFQLSAALYVPTMVLFGITMTGGVVAAVLGFGGLSKENKWRTKLTIIFGFLALILATIGFLLLIF